VSRFVALPKVGCRNKQWLIVNELTGGLIAEFTGGRAGASKVATRLQAAADARVERSTPIKGSQP
jgi:hypothetical protein